MASPQLENGYTRLSNELLEKIVRYPFKGYELKIILKIARDTYGWKTKKRQISYGRIAKDAKIDRRHVVKYCSLLVGRNIIFKQKLKNRDNLWGINKDYEEWLMKDGSLFIDLEEEAPKKEIPEWREMWVKNSFPLLTEIIESEIIKIIKEHGDIKFIEALKISAKQNNKKLAYIEGILKRQKDGVTNDDATGKTQISDGRWMTDEELAEAEMKGEIYYESNGNKWITK